MYREDKNINAIWGLIHKPKISNNIVTYYGDYNTPDEFINKTFMDKILVWHTSNFEKEEWRSGLYGLNCKDLHSNKEEINISTFTYNPKIHFITYADEKFKYSKERIDKEAIHFGHFDTVTIYGPEDLDNNFKAQFREILKLPRGGGYWIWRPYILEKKFNEINDNDILIFLDAGCTINIAGKNKFYE